MLLLWRNGGYSEHVRTHQRPRRLYHGMSQRNRTLLARLAADHTSQRRARVWTFAKLTADPFLLTSLQRAQEITASAGN
jgi:hypothetical protein